MSDPKEPFVPRADRPELSLDPEAPLSQLRVRDLNVILSGTVLKVIQDHKIIEKHLKHEKFEKIEKFEKHEKFEWEKHHKPEKLEYEVFKNTFEGIPDPTNQIDPIARRGLEQVISQVAGLSEQVGALAKQIEELQKKLG